MNDLTDIAAEWGIDHVGGRFGKRNGRIELFTPHKLQKKQAEELRTRVMTGWLRLPGVHEWLAVVGIEWPKTPLNLSVLLALAAVGADFMAEHVFNHLDIQGWMARIGFQMMDPLKTAKARLDFLMQELNREANTLCSKANDVSLSRIGLDLKAIVEQFREQVQNVE